MEVDTTPPQQVTDPTLVTSNISDINVTESITENDTGNITEQITENSTNNEVNPSPDVKESKPEHKIPSDYDTRMLWMKGVLENGFSYEHEVTKRAKQAQKQLLDDKQRYYTNNNSEDISMFEECLERNNRENYTDIYFFFN